MSAKLVMLVRPERSGSCVSWLPARDRSCRPDMPARVAGSSVRRLPAGQQTVRGARERTLMRGGTAEG